MFSKNASTMRRTRFLSVLTALGILTTGLFVPSPASAAGEGGLVYEQNGWRVLYESSEKVPVSDDRGTLTLKGGTTYTVSRDTNASKDCRINFESGSVGDVTVRLDGVDCSENTLEGTSGFDARRGTDNTTIYLLSDTTNVFQGWENSRSSNGSPGIAKDDGGGVLMIAAENESGGLTATGGTYSAGIGGAGDASVSGITISGGTVTATGGGGGAGIGGGNAFGGGYSVSGITISGGTVTATGGGGGAGIGGGQSYGGYSVSGITISGGTVTATSGGAGAGIGGGYDGSVSGISISDATVIARSTGGDSAGIGAGGGKSVDGIRISRSNVIAIGQGDGAGIGGSWNGSAWNIVIEDSTVTAIGGTGGGRGETFGIGRGAGGSWIGQVVIRGGSVKAYSLRSDGAPIDGVPVNNESNGEHVYLAKIPATTSTNTITVDAGTSRETIYRRQDFHHVVEGVSGSESDDGMFYAYLPGSRHTVDVGRNQYDVRRVGDASEFEVHQPVAPRIVSATANASSITPRVDSSVAGELQYRWSKAGTEDWSAWNSTEPSGLDANTRYLVEAKRVDGGSESWPSEPFTVTTAPSVAVPGSVTATYGQTLQETTGLSEGWQWVNPSDSVGDAGGDRVHQAVRDVNPPEANVTWTGLPNGCEYVLGQNRVQCGVSVRVGQAIPQVVIDPVADRVYDGNEQPDPSVRVTGVDGGALSDQVVSFVWEKQKTVDVWELVADGRVVDAGTYRVVGKVAANGNYAAAQSAPVEFRVTPARLTVQVADIANRGYDGQAQEEPEVTVTGVKDGEPDPTNVRRDLVWQKKTDDGQYTDLSGAPVDVGVYRARVTVTTDNGNYESPVVVYGNDFEITKADSSVTIGNYGDFVYNGKPVEKPEVTRTGSGADLEYEWAKKIGDNQWGEFSGDAPTDVGEYQVRVTLPADEHYGATFASKEFRIQPADLRVVVSGVGDRSYDGKVPELPQVTVTGVNGESLRVSQREVWEKEENGQWVKIDADGVRDVGRYRVSVVVTVSGDNNYAPVTTNPVEFKITPGVNTWTEEPSIDGGVTEWVAGDRAPEIHVGKAGYGTPVVVWTDSDGKVVEGVPSVPGVYTVTVTVPESGDWGEVSKTFTVRVKPVPQAASITLRDAFGNPVTEAYAGLKAVAIVDGVYVPEVLKRNPVVRFMLHSTPVELGVARVVDGKAVLEFAFPSVELGDHSVRAVLGDAEIGVVGVQVVGLPTPVPVPEGGSGGGLVPVSVNGNTDTVGLASTGASVFPFALLGLVLLAGGAGVFITRSRRRA